MRLKVSNAVRAGRPSSRSCVSSALARANRFSTLNVASRRVTFARYGRPAARGVVRPTHALERVLFADGAVDQLTRHVQMAGMPGVLLEDVGQDPTQRGAVGLGGE